MGNPADVTCDFCDLRDRRVRAEQAGQTITVVAVGDRHARWEVRFSEGPVNVFLDGTRVARYDRLPRTCTC